MIPRRAVDLLCLAMVLTLGVHARYMPIWLSVPLALLLVGRWWQLRHGARRAPMWLKLPMVALLLAAVVLAWGTLFGRAPGSALAVGLLILKLLETSTARDIRSAVTFGCFVLMSALLFDQSMSFTLLVMLGLLPNLAALRAVQRSAAAPSWRAELQPVARSVLLALPLALFAFLFVPRLASPLWGAPGADSARTGLSNSMSPGNLTELLVDDSPAMRVSFDGAPPPRPQRYFRAWVMSDFDGRSWRHAWRQHPGDDEALEVVEAIDYTIQLEPTRGRLLPALDVPVGAPADAWMSANHTLFSRRDVESVRRYSARSAVRYRLQRHIDPSSQQLNLALPQGFDPRARQLAADWQRRFGDDHAAIAAAALALFHDGGFSYTLAPAPLGRNSIDDFLFSTREGFCEHYASSFTFLMRAAGIPARVVTGYQGGWWSRYGNYLLVRKSDAHAWSELWLQGRGWVRYDPTAAVRPERVSLGATAAAGDSAAWYQAGWIKGVRNRWDIVNRWWGKAVVAFNRQRQKGLLTPFGVSDAGLQQLTLVLAVGCSLLLALATWLTLPRRRKADRLLAIQRRLERQLARLGVARGRNEGPRDFLQRAMRELPANAAQLERLYTHYIDLRYVRQRPSPRAIAAYGKLVSESIRRGMVK